MSVWPSEQESLGLEGLGVTPVIRDEDRQTQVTMGTIDSTETGWPAYAFQHLAIATPYVTPNLVLWPRTTALFANPDSLASLSDVERGWVEEAALDTRDRSIMRAGADDARQLAEQCDQGARVALASRSQLEAARDAVRPVYDALVADPGIAETVQWLEEVRSAHPPGPPPEVPARCRYDASDPVSAPARPVQLSAPGEVGRVPLGTYRVRVTPSAVEALQDRLRVPVWSEPVEDRDATMTWRLGEGTWDLRISYADGRVDPWACRGFFAVRDDRAWFTTVVDEHPGQCAPPSWSAHWTLDVDAPDWSGVEPADFGLAFDVLRWERIS
jgi:hypothetical protein